MFAVLKTGGKQYKVAVNDVIRIEKLAGEAGDTVTFDSILMHGNGDGMTVGTPMVSGAVVTGEILEQFRDKKVIAFKKRRRKHGSATKKGHRQYLTKVRIAGIPGDEDGSKAGKREKPAAKKKAAPTDDADADAAKAKADADAAEAKADDAAKADAKPALIKEIEGFTRPANMLDTDPGDGDDLTKLPGLGVASQKQLNEMGVYYYKQFTDWGPADWDYVEAYVETNLEGRVNVERASIMVQINKLLEAREE